MEGKNMLDRNEQQIVIMIFATQKPFSLSSIDDNFYPAYLTYEYEIEDPFYLHQLLIEHGYYEPSTPEQILESFNLAMLKELIGNRGKKSGKKPELIERAMNLYTSEELAAMLPSDYYSLSDKGRMLLDQCQDFILLHQNKLWEITYDEYCLARNQMAPQYSFRDVIWRILNERIAKTDPIKNYGCLRNIYYTMSDVTKKLDHSDKKAASLLLTTFLFDICTVIDDIYSYQSAGAPLTDISCDTLFFAPAIIKSLTDSKDLLPEIPYRSVIKPPYFERIYTEKDYNDLVADLSGNSPFDSEKWYKLCEKRSSDFVSQFSAKGK